MLKRRLLVAPMTQEDINAWLAIESRHGPGMRYHPLTCADRRDADLMLEVRQARCLHLIIERDTGPDFFLWVFGAGDSLHRYRSLESWP